MNEWNECSMTPQLLGTIVLSSNTLHLLQINRTQKFSHKTLIQS